MFPICCKWVYHSTTYANVHTVVCVCAEFRANQSPVIREVTQMDATVTGTHTRFHMPYCYGKLIASFLHTIHSHIFILGTSYFFYPLIKVLYVSKVLFITHTHTRAMCVCVCARARLRGRRKWGRERERASWALSSESLEVVCPLRREAFWSFYFLQ